MNIRLDNRRFLLLFLHCDRRGQSIPVQILLRYHFIQSVIGQAETIVGRRIDILLHKVHTIVVCFRDIIQIRGIHRRHLIQILEFKRLGDLVFLLHRLGKGQGSIRAVSGKDITPGIIRVTGLVCLIPQGAKAVDDLLTVRSFQRIRSAPLTLGDHTLYHRYRRFDRGLGQLQPGLCIRDILLIELLDLGQIGTQTQCTDRHDRIFGGFLDLLSG